MQQTYSKRYSYIDHYLYSDGLLSEIRRKDYNDNYELMYSFEYYDNLRIGLLYEYDHDSGEMKLANNKTIDLYANGKKSRVYLHSTII